MNQCLDRLYLVLWWKILPCLRAVRYSRNYQYPIIELGLDEKLMLSLDQILLIYLSEETILTVMFAFNDPDPGVLLLTWFVYTSKIFLCDDLCMLETSQYD